jgi:hypothetical protein
MKGFIVSAIRTSIALLMALVAFALLYGGYSRVNEWWQRRGDVPYNRAKDWTSDLSSTAGFLVEARTKFLNNELLMVVTVTSKAAEQLPLFSDLVVRFVDSDGFEVYEKSFERHEFTQIVDSLGRANAYSVESGSSISREDYARFSKLSISWTSLVQSEPTPILLDPCESNISKAERLRRLRKFGVVTQKAQNLFEAGGRSVHFFEDGSLLSCE